MSVFVLRCPGGFAARFAPRLNCSPLCRLPSSVKISSRLSSRSGIRRPTMAATGSAEGLAACRKVPATWGALARGPGPVGWALLNQIKWPLRRQLAPWAGRVVRRRQLAHGAGCHQLRGYNLIALELTNVAVYSAHTWPGLVSDGPTCHLCEHVNKAGPPTSPSVNALCSNEMISNTRTKWTLALFVAFARRPKRAPQRGPHNLISRHFAN